MDVYYQAWRLFFRSKQLCRAAPIKSSRAIKSLFLLFTFKMDLKKPSSELSHRKHDILLPRITKGCIDVFLNTKLWLEKKQIRLYVRRMLLNSWSVGTATNKKNIYCCECGPSKQEPRSPTPSGSHYYYNRFLKCRSVSLNKLNRH